MNTSLISAKSPETLQLSFIKAKLHAYPRGVCHCWNLQQRPRLVPWSSENIALISYTSWTWLILARRDGNTEQATTRVMRKVYTQRSMQHRSSEVQSCANIKSSQVHLGQGNGYPPHDYLLAYILQDLQIGSRWPLFFCLWCSERHTLQKQKLLSLPLCFTEENCLLLVK